MVQKPDVDTVECDALIGGGGMSGCGASYEAAFWAKRHGLRAGSRPSLRQPDSLSALLLLDLAQKENPGIRGEAAAVEGHGDFLAGNGWKMEGKKAIHGGYGAPLPCVAFGATIRIIHEIKALPYIRRFKIAPGTNNSG